MWFDKFLNFCEQKDGFFCKSKNLHSNVQFDRQCGMPIHSDREETDADLQTNVSLFAACREEMCERFDIFIP